MKKVLKIGGIILLVVYAAMAITLTLFLLKYNDYNITEINGMKVAFVGISTPESYTKSTPVYFQDENGNDIYKKFGY